MTLKTIHSEPYQTVTNWLRTNRKARGLTMRTVAARLKVPHSWVAKVEQGERRLDIIEFTRLCLALGLDPHEGVDLILSGTPSSYHTPVPARLAAERAPRYGLRPR